MTVSATNTFSGPYVANGATTAFPFTFEAASADEVGVTLDGANQISGYTVALNADGNGGTLTFSSAPANGALVLPFANPDFTQDINFTDAGPFLPTTHTEALDRAALRSVYLKGRVDASIRVPVGETIAELPSVAVRAGLYQAFDAQGDPVASSGTGADAGLRTDMAAETGSLLVLHKKAGTGTYGRTLRGWAAAGGMFDSNAHNYIDPDLDADIADGTNAVDLGAMVEAAIEADGETVFGIGTYLISPRTLAGMVSLGIRGAGRDKTRIRLASTGTMLTLSNVQWAQISDMSIEASGVAQSLANAVGLAFTDGSCNGVIQRVNFYGFSLDGLRMAGTGGSHQSGHTLNDVYILGCGRNQFYGAYCDDFTLNNVQFGSLAGITHADFGLLLENCGEGFLGNTKSWNNERAIKMLNCTGMRYAGIRAELSDFENVWIEGGYSHSFDNACRFYSASQGGNGVSDNIYLQDTSIVSLPVEATTWDATFARYAVNVHTGCSRIKLDGIRVGGYDVAKGPIRIDSSATRVRGASQAFAAPAVAAGSTVYISVNGASAGEGTPIHCDTPMQALGMVAACTAAPGAAQTFTYTLRKNGVDTGLTLTITGAASFLGKAKAATPLPALVFDEDDFWSIKLVTSAGAAVANHRITLGKVEI